MKALLLGEPKNREYLESVAFGTQQIVALDPPLRGHPVVVMSSVRFSAPVGETGYSEVAIYPVELAGHGTFQPLEYRELCVVGGKDDAVDVLNGMGYEVANHEE